MDPDHTMWPNCNFFDDNGFHSPAYLNNSVCNTQLNNVGCGYDGGALFTLVARLILKVLARGIEAKNAGNNVDFRKFFRLGYSSIEWYPRCGKWDGGHAWTRLNVEIHSERNFFLWQETAVLGPASTGRSSHAQDLTTTAWTLRIKQHQRQLLRT